MESRAQRVKVLGDRACLDLVNSANWEGGSVADEAFESPADVIEWAVHADLLPESAGRQWRARLQGDPGTATLVADVRALRQALRDLFAASVQRAPLPARASAALNARLRRGGPGTLAVRGAQASCLPERNAWAQSLLHRLAASAMELLVSADRDALKACGGNRCGWFFLDRSRAHTRRWCEMETCGNREKARRHYERIKDD